VLRRHHARVAHHLPCFLEASGFHSKTVVDAVEQTGADVYIADRYYRQREPAFPNATRHKERVKKERALLRRKKREARTEEKRRLLHCRASVSTTPASLRDRAPLGSDRSACRSLESHRDSASGCAAPSPPAPCRADIFCRSDPSEPPRARRDCRATWSVTEGSFQLFAAAYSARILLPGAARRRAAASFNMALQLTGLSVAALPLAPAAERRYVMQPPQSMASPKMTSRTLTVSCNEKHARTHSHRLVAVAVAVAVAGCAILSGCTRAETLPRACVSRATDGSTPMASSVGETLARGPSESPGKAYAIERSFVPVQQLRLSLHLPRTRTAPLTTVLVFHSAMGRTESVLESCDRLAEHGFAAVALDFYDGHVAAALSEATTRFGEFTCTGDQSHHPGGLPPTRE